MAMGGTFSALLSTLAEHEETSERLSALDDFSGHFAATLKQVADIPDHRGTHFKKTAERYVQVLLRFNFVALVCRRKIDAIALMIRSAIESRSAIALAHATRALMEHVAVLAAVDRKIGAFANAIRGQGDPVKIHETLLTAEKFVERCYYGKSPKVAGAGTIEALHINDCLDDLEKVCVGSREDYDFLCEFVHPNHGSNALVSTADDVKMMLASIVSDFSRPEIERMGATGGTMLRKAQQLDLTVAAHFGLLGRYVQVFLKPRSKISNVFAKRKLKPTGDGKTVESALCFEQASGLEAIELIYEYLDGRRLQLQSPSAVCKRGRRCD